MPPSTLATHRGGDLARGRLRCGRRRDRAATSARIFGQRTRRGGRRRGRASPARSCRRRRSARSAARRPVRRRTRPGRSARARDRARRFGSGGSTPFCISARGLGARSVSGRRTISSKLAPSLAARVERVVQFGHQRGRLALATSGISSARACSNVLPATCSIAVTLATVKPPAARTGPTTALRRGGEHRVGDGGRGLRGVRGLVELGQRARFQPDRARGGVERVPAADLGRRARRRTPGRARSRPARVRFSLAAKRARIGLVGGVRDRRRSGSPAPSTLSGVTNA